MSKPEVFIIESLKLNEEKNHREGEVICRTLRMPGKKPRYHYVRTIVEFKHFVDVFKKSGYRYLHISCHGNQAGVCTTFDEINVADFAGIVGPALNGRRLFFSTCLASTIEMAKSVFNKGRCISLIGPKGKIDFDDSVVLWTSFYHLMFKVNERAMNGKQINDILAKCESLLEEEMNYFIKHNGKVILKERPSDERRRGCRA